MASKEIEVLDPTATVEKLNKMASRRAMNRRNFVTALGVAGAAAGAALVSGRKSARPGTVSAAGLAPTDYINFLLNLEYLEATFYSYITTGADLPASVTAGSGTIYQPPAKVTFPTQQITDLVNEIYYDELSHVMALINLQNGAAVVRPAMNLQGLNTTSSTTAVVITPGVALATARLFEDIGVTAYTTVAAALAGASQLTSVAQLLAVEGFHSGALRLAVIQQGLASTPYEAQGNTSFIGVTTSGSAVITNTYVGLYTAVTAGQLISGPGIPAGATVVSSGGANITTITATTTAGSAVLTVVSSITGVAVGEVINGTNIPTNSTITAITATTITISAAVTGTAGTVSTKVALTIGGGTVTISAPTTASGPGTFTVVQADSPDDVEPGDPGAATLAANGPTAIPGTSPVIYQGFFDTAGSATATASTPAGFAFARTTAQILTILYSSPTVPAYNGLAKGGYFPLGLNGAISGIPTQG